MTARDDEKPGLKGRGWRKEHLVVLRDLVTGEDVPVWTGLTRDPFSDTDREVSAIAFGDGPTLLFGENAGQLRVNIRATDDEAREAQRAQTRRPGR